MSSMPQYLTAMVHMGPNGSLTIPTCSLCGAMVINHYLHTQWHMTRGK